MKTTERVHELLLNYACSAKCAFCYNPPITDELLRREATLRQAAESLSAAAAAGAKRLNLHGGEVTLRDDLPQVLALARKLGFVNINVVTNGVRLGEKAYARKLVDCGATEFRFSLHASTAALHDSILKLPGAYDKAFAGVRHLRSMGVPVGVNFVLHRDNVHDLPASLKRFKEELGLSDFIVYYPHYRGMAALNAGVLKLTYAEAAAAAREAVQACAELFLANFPPCVAPDLRERMLDWSHEDGGGDSLHIPEGDTHAVADMKHGQRMKAPRCSSCSLDARCSGFEREYAELYGTEDFVPCS